MSTMRPSLRQRALWQCSKSTGSKQSARIRSSEACPPISRFRTPCGTLPKLGGSQAGFATHAGSSSRDPFVPAIHKLHRERSVRQFQKGEHEEDYEYLRDLVAEQIADRVKDITKEFEIAVDLGCHTGNVAKKMAELSDEPGTFPGGIKKLIQLDISQDITTEAHKGATTALGPDSDVALETRVANFEQLETALEPNSVDMVVSNLSLHWANDLPQVLTKIAGALRSDGVFLAAMFGGDTLFEMRTALAFAEQEREGGISSHISPMLPHADACGLLSAAGFNLSTVDTMTINVEYEDIFSCAEHLSRMGESNAGKLRRSVVPRETWAAAAAAYQGLFGDETGYVPTTFQIVFMIGWKPHHSQPSPLARGSAKKSIAEISRITNDKNKNN